MDSTWLVSVVSVVSFVVLVPVGSFFVVLVSLVGSDESVVSLVVLMYV